MTPQQLQAIKADILANPDLSAFPAGPDGAFAIAAAYNQPAAPAFYVWRSSMATAEVYDAIVWANLTPNDTPDGTQLWLNRALACQGKQFNVQTLLTGRETINPAKANVRNGLQDALTAIPSGPNGNARAAGWVTLQLAMSRLATRLEKLLATGGAGTQPNPAGLVFEGAIDYTAIEQARAS